MIIRLNEHLFCKWFYLSIINVVSRAICADFTARIGTVNGDSNVGDVANRRWSCHRRSFERLLPGRTQEMAGDFLERENAVLALAFTV